MDRALSYIHSERKLFLSFVTIWRCVYVFFASSTGADNRYISALAAGSDDRQYLTNRLNLTSGTFVTEKILKVEYIILVIFLIAQSSAWASPIYVIKNRDGSVTFTTKTPAAGVQAKVFTAKKLGFSVYHSGLGSHKRRPLKEQSKRYLPLIHKVAKQSGVNPHLVTALIHVESAFNPEARSPKGAMGLTQLMPATAKMLGVKRPYEPSDNVRGGVRYLSMLLKKYRGNLKLSLAAYNAGEGAVDKYRGIPPYRETQNYVRSVESLFSAYAKLHG